MITRATGILLCLGLSAVGAAAAVAEEAGKAARERAEAEASSPYMRAVSDKEAARAPAERLSFSNDDLEERYGPPPELPVEAEESTEAGVDPQAEPPPEGAVEATARAEGVPEAQAAVDPQTTDGSDDPLQQLADEQAQRVDHREKISEAERKVEQARSHITTLERRMLALRNPLLARPQPPEKEREAWEGADNEERLARSEEEMTTAQNALAEAEQELARLQSAP